MKIVVTGATGFIGRSLVRRLIARGDTVIALTRSASHARTRLGPSVQAFEWAPPAVGDWLSAIEEADAIVNLAGEPVEAKRWSEAQKDRIRSSRIQATKAIVDAVSTVRTPPRVLVNGSAIGFYGDQGSAELTERSSSGDDFLASVVVAWEEAARPVESHGVRLALARTGVVLGRGGGALPLYVLPFRLFTGGAVGRPDAWVSWVHIDDEVGAIVHAVDDDRVAGPFNVTAPKPVTVEVLSRHIGKVLHRPVWVPKIATGIKLGLGELGDSVMASQRVVPTVLAESGYAFRYTDIEPALQALLDGTRMAAPRPAHLLTTFRSRGMLEALSSVAFDDKE